MYNLFLKAPIRLDYLQDVGLKKIIYAVLIFFTQKV